MRPWALFLFQLQLIVAAVAASAAADCQTQCGNITIPYPFGIGRPGCYRPGFNLTCDHSSTSGPRLYLGDGTLEATDILISQGQVLIKSPILRLFCDPGEPVQGSYNTTWRGIGDNGPFTFSADRNAFVTIGCSVISYVTSFYPDAAVNLCAAICFDYTSVERINGSCSEMGCCQTTIGRSQSYFFVRMVSGLNIGSKSQQHSMEKWRTCGQQGRQGSSGVALEEEQEAEQQWCSAGAEESNNAGAEEGQQ